jgi:hypothetical protein
MINKTIFVSIYFFFITILKGIIVDKTILRDDEFSQNTNKNSIVELKLKKSLVIKPSSIDQENPPLLSIARKSSAKNLILLGSRKPDLKIYRFDNKGSLKNSFLSRGEGPGELLSIYNLQILDKVIIAKDYKKIVKYHINGTFNDEIKPKMASFFTYFINENQYIINKTESDESGDPIRHLALVSINQGNIITSFSRDAKRKDIGETGVLNQKLYHDWITPDYKFVFLPSRNCLVYGLSDNTFLTLKDLKGKTIKTIEINFKKRTIPEEDRNQIIESFKRIKSNTDLYKGLIKRIAKEFLTIVFIKLLPKDYFAVFLAIGYQKYMVKIFDKNLNYFCDIMFPESILSRFELHKIHFYEKGFYVIEDTDDENQYVEYQIENLKQIFGQN